MKQIRLASISLVLASLTTTQAGHILGVRTHAGTSAEELSSQIAQTQTATGLHEATAISVATSPNGTVTTSSAMAIPECDGYTVVLSFDCRRAWTVGARPAMAFDPVGTTNAFEITVLSTDDFTLQTEWTVSGQGSQFGMPAATLFSDRSFLANLFDPWIDGANPAGSRVDQIAGQTEARTLKISLAGNAFATTPALEPNEHQMQGQIVLKFGFTPAPARILQTIVENDSVHLRLEAGSYGQLNVIQLASDLNSDSWQDLTTVYSTGEPIDVILPISPGNPAGFYRSRLATP